MKQSNTQIVTQVSSELMLVCGMNNIKIHY